MPARLQPYWRVRHELRVLEEVPMMVDRTVIPVNLRQAVLDTLHAAHQCVYSMILRAETAVYWPGYIGDIQATKDKCQTCHRSAPSQAKLPPIEPVVPKYPFEHICMDYMTLNAKNYGVLLDSEKVSLGNCLREEHVPHLSCTSSPNLT